MATHSKLSLPKSGINGNPSQVVILKIGINGKPSQIVFAHYFRSWCMPQARALPFGLEPHGSVKKPVGLQVDLYKSGKTKGGF
eukprot:6490333-Amphidinium_carterae.1